MIQDTVGSEDVSQFEIYFRKKKKKQPKTSESTVSENGYSVETSTIANKKVHTVNMPMSYSVRFTHLKLFMLLL